MGMTWIPQSLANVAGAFFGEHWQTSLAIAFDVDEETVTEWETDPSTMTADMQERLTLLGETRLEEIKIMLMLLKEAGLSRDVADG